MKQVKVVAVKIKSKPLPLPKLKSKRGISRKGHPKHPTTAFLFFRTQLNKNMMKEKVGLKLTHVSKVAGELWAKTSEEDRRPFQKLAAADKERFEA